ncbi:polysaccharide export protein [Massilia sp. H-1]|nr:polysaccharide export protein [Massilia sp. H-1]
MRAISPSPNVTLRVQAYRSKRVYIDGEVKSPGLQAINDIPMTLTEALNRVDGVLPTADQSRIALERGDARFMIDLRALVAKGINPGDVMLAHGDLVRVHSRDESKVFVSGEVVAPRADHARWPPHIERSAGRIGRHQSHDRRCAPGVCGAQGHGRHACLPARRAGPAHLPWPSRSSSIPRTWCMWPLRRWPTGTAT